MSLLSLMRWAGAPARGDEPVEARRSRNIVSGVFLGVGVLLASLALFVLPGWSVAHPETVVVIACFLAGGSLMQVVTAAQVPVIVNHVTSLIAAVALAVVQILVVDQIAVGAVGVMYVWVSVLVAMYYSPMAATVHVAMLVAAQIVAAAWIGRVALLPQTVLSIGTCIMVAVLIGMLTTHMRQQMQTDPLTRLVNRRGLDQAFAVNIAAALREGEPLCVATLDLDAFKHLNDTHGHAAGDAALVDTALAWQRVLRPNDTLARVGGDEFVVLLPGCGVVRARGIIGRLLDATPSIISCSAGITLYRRGDTPDALLARADAALYRAKDEQGPAIVVDEASLAA